MIKYSKYQIKNLKYRLIMWYLISFLYFGLGLVFGVVELRTRQQLDQISSNKSWWVVPVNLFFWLPMLIICAIVVTIEKIKRL